MENPSKVKEKKRVSQVAKKIIASFTFLGANRLFKKTVKNEWVKTEGKEQIVAREITVQGLKEKIAEEISVGE